MLFDAIDRGDAGAVWQQVQRGIQFDQIDESTELTPLALAAEAGHAEIVRILLSAGASPDLGGATTPLEAAVVGGHHEVVEALLGHNADVNKAVEEGFTPLMTAATTGDLELVRTLLSAGARPRAKNDDGDTAITLAEEAGHFGVAVVLRARRPRKPSTANNGKTSTPPKATRKEAPEITNSEPTSSAREVERTSPASPIIRSQAVNPAPTPQDVSPKESPVEEPEQESRKVPLQEVTVQEIPSLEGVVENSFNTEDSTQAEPARSPAQVSPEEEAASEKIGSQALQDALDHLCTLWKQGAGRTEQALRDGQPAPHFTDPHGYTLLMAAAHAGEVEIVRLLLAAGADSAQCDATDDGFSALVWAVRSPSDRRIEVLKTLVEAGANPDQRCGPNQRTPLMFAAQADVYLDRPEGPSFGNTTRILVELGADLEAQDRRGLTVWRLMKRDAMGAPTFGSSRRRLHQMVRVLEYCGAQPIESHAV